ncbi:MAG: twin-arginine translocase subunit TatC [Chloroflexi bacterium]|nr:twin-arginine translocase subunit TatC [Chloroflexota bacterium]
MATNETTFEGATLREHLEELRKRLMYTVIFVVIAVVIAFMFREAIFDFLLAPGGYGGEKKPQATEVLETVSVIFKVTMMVGFIGALPFVLYQIIMFVSPGLTGRERFYLFMFLPGVLIAFAGGAAFGYYVLFPPAFEFLSGFGNEFVNADIRISSYINVMLSLIFWMGVVFQIPLVLFGLGRLGVVTPSMLGKFRRFAIVLAFIAAAIITPTFDPVNQILVAVPIIILYEIGILLARVGQRMKNGPNPDAKRGRIMRAVARLGVLRFWRWHFRFWRGD